MRNWHLLYTKPHKEELVAQQLDARDLDVFFPTLRFERNHGRPVLIEPFFPHYLFVRVDLTAAEASGLRWLAGVRSLVGFGGVPAVVPDRLINDLRARLEPYRHKTLRKDEWIFRAGERVAVNAGPLAGYEAIFQRGLGGGQRVQLLLDMMGSWTKVELSIDQVRPLTTS